jgi:Flp pilus assembly pilin Flp
MIKGCFVRSQLFTNFRESEDGRVNVEYAVIPALAVIGLLDKACG